MILDVEDIHTYYGDSYVLQGITLQMCNSSTIALLGRNGVGKTTFIRSIIGFNSPREGSITFEGVNITHLPPEKIAKLGIGLIPQGRRVFPSLSVRENLMVAGRTKGTQGWTTERVFELFPRLKERASHLATKLSGGEQQMLSISRALMGNPDLLLMDEPTEGLAPLIVDNVREVVHGFKGKGLSVLLVEQNLNFALDLADHIYVMSEGKIAYEFSPGEFQQNKQIIYGYLGV